MYESSITGGYDVFAHILCSTVAGKTSGASGGPAIPDRSCTSINLTGEGDRSSWAIVWRTGMSEI